MNLTSIYPFGRRRQIHPESTLSLIESDLPDLSLPQASSYVSDEEEDGNDDEDENDDELKRIGPLGLIALNSPLEALVELVFVHGLGGGSRKSWSRSRSEHHFWPKSWLSRDPAFQNVRIHSFGYKSAKTEFIASITGIPEIALSLLNALKDSPDTRSTKNAIILVGHSMGGLVIKKAFILAHARQAYSDLSPRLRSLYFFGTPHRGSQVTTNFRRLFKIVPYVSPTENISDIDPTSRLLESLNQDFPQICQNIEIRSYFEKEKSLILPEPDYIVPKHSAALNYKNETLDGLDADHRGMCKFQRLSDPNFQQVRNALLSTVDSIIIKISKENRVEHTETLKHLRDYLGVRDVPEDDLLDNQDHCLQHDSCAWFTSSKKYVLWRDSPTQSVHTSASNRCNLMMVIEGDPGAGKSVLSSQIINNLQGLNYECSYYFLISQGKFRVGGLLRSLAYQMALLSPVVRQAIIDLKQEDVQLQVEDDRLVWRRLFVNCIFRCKIDRPQYWVIDGLDECGNAKSLTQMLSKIEAGTPFKVLLTTRPANEIRSELAALDGKFTHIPLTEADTRLSIRDYVEARSRRMGLRKENHRLTLVKKIMDRSNRNFLWVRLVMDEKEKASGPKEILQSLDEEIPKGMNSLYKRIVEQLEDETPTKQKPILKAVLEWVVCSNPMLSVDELEAAILLDTEEEIYASKMCDLSRNLIRIDQGKKVHMVHSTARQYLLKEARESKFAVNSAEANLRLASTLIKHLQRSLRPVKSAAQLSITIRQESGIRNYAVSNFSDHMRRASSEDVMLLLDVERFLSSQGLTWISHVASTGLLQHLCPRQVHLLACPC